MWYNTPNEMRKRGGFMTDSIYRLRWRTDLYEWGKGYVSADAVKKWREFMENWKPTLCWVMIKPESSGECYRIASLRSSVYLHPMSGLVTLEDESEVEWLTAFLKDAAKAAGGNCEVFVQRIQYELEI